MKYLPEIITFLLWPAMIAVSYYACRWALRYYAKRHGDTTDAE